MPWDSSSGIWETPYSPPDPRELPAIRYYLCDLMEEPRTVSIFLEFLADDRLAYRPPGPPIVAVQRLLEDERNRLAKASLYWISPEMTQVAVAAAESLPEDLRIDQTHQPATHGFVVFGEPIGSYVGDLSNERRVPIVAMTWGATRHPAQDEKATWVTFYSPRDKGYIRHIMTRMANRPPRPDEVNAVVRATPEWMWDNEIIIPHTGTIADLNHSHELLQTLRSDSVMPWMKVLYSSWLLMTQPGITEVEQQRASRKQQQRDQRRGIGQSDVRLIRVHRRHRDSGPASKQTDESTDREFTVRWMVRGHWRNQAHGPGYTLRRPTWINPHVKGPDDKPLKTGNIVNVWDR